MSKKHKYSAGRAHTQAASVSPWQIAVVAGVVLLIVGVLWLKNRPGILETVATKAQPTLGVHTGAATFVTLSPATPTAAVVGAGDDVVAEAHTLAPRADESPEAHLNRLLDEGQPIFAFFHSNTCYQCTEMAKIVEQVYPDFAEQVALVDVNVYDEANNSLLQRAGISVIPTLIFIDRAGQDQSATGIVPAEQLREALAALAAGETP